MIDGLTSRGQHAAADRPARSGRHTFEEGVAPLSERCRSGRRWRRRRWPVRGNGLHAPERAQHPAERRAREGWSAGNV